jgi:hypothetical protein
MFKKILIALALVAVIGVLVFGAVNRTLAKNGNVSNNGSRNGNGYSDIQSESITDSVGNGYGQGRNAQDSTTGSRVTSSAASSGELSDAEASALIYMREEEKLARDVYITLGAQWNLPIFQNISQSEQTHMDAIKDLLDRYGLSDPASNEIGIFTNSDLQALYNDLTALGSQSIAEALKVGAAIEEIDILDLQNRLPEIDNADIQKVFNNLLNGSSNHLRSFVSTLNTQTGEIYQSQYLDEQSYQTIISTTMQTGGNGNGGKNMRGGSNGRRP